MRLLTLAPDQNRRYQILQFALYLSPEGLKKGEHGPHAKMCALFAAIGTRDERSLPSADMPDPLPKYTLGGGDVALEEQQFALLLKHFNASLEVLPKAWSGEIGEMETWLAGIPSVEGSIAKPA